jgi:hypothetical protein
MCDADHIAAQRFARRVSDCLTGRVLREPSALLLLMCSSVDPIAATERRRKWRGPIQRQHSRTSTLWLNTSPEGPAIGCDVAVLILERDQRAWWFNKSSTCAE